MKRSGMSVPLYAFDTYKGLLAVPEWGIYSSEAKSTRQGGQL